MNFKTDVLKNNERLRVKLPIDGGKKLTSVAICRIFPKILNLYKGL
jgi:hypothetical protein